MRCPHPNEALMMRSWNSRCSLASLVTSFTSTVLSPFTTASRWRHSRCLCVCVWEGGRVVCVCVCVCVCVTLCRRCVRMCVLYGQRRWKGKGEKERDHDNIIIVTICIILMNKGYGWHRPWCKEVVNYNYSRCKCWTEPQYSTSHPDPYYNVIVILTDIGLPVYYLCKYHLSTATGSSELCPVSSPRYLHHCTTGWLLKTVGPLLVIVHSITAD